MLSSNELSTSNDCFMKKEVVLIGLILIAFIAFISSCEKEAGEGGTSHLLGEVFVLDYNSEGILKDSFYAPDKKVFIIYGDNDIFDDETRTNYDGAFQFNYLYKGNYTIFAYSKCDSCPSGEEPIFQHVEVTDRGTTYELPRLTIID